MHLDTQDKTGAGIGFVMGVIQSALTGSAFFTTIILSFVGALVGFLSTELFKYCKRKFFS